VKEQASTGAGGRALHRWGRGTRTTHGLVPSALFRRLWACGSADCLRDVLMPRGNSNLQYFVCTLRRRNDPAVARILRDFPNDGKCAYVLAGFLITEAE